VSATSGSPTSGSFEPDPTARSGPGLARAATLIAVITVLARLMGFARVVIFARTVGPSCLGDAYYTANTIPNIVFDIVAGGALSSLVVPVLAAPAAAGDRSTVDRTVSALLSWAAVLLVPVMAVGLLLTHPLIRPLVGSGHPQCPPGSEVSVGARMLAVFLPQVVIYGAAVILIGTLQAHRRFLGPAAGPLVSSVVVSAAYLVFAAVAGSRETGLSTLTRRHELVLSVGTTLGVAALLVPMVGPTIRTGIRLRPTLRFPPGVASTIRRMAVSGAVVLGSQDIATAVVLRLANQRGTGGAVVMYTLAWTVFTVPWAVAAVPLATSAFPGLTATWQSGARDRYADTLARTARVMVVVVGGAAAVMAASAVPLARVVVLGAPGHVAPDVLARGLVCFAPGLPGYALVALMSRALYAQGNARTPAAAAAGGWAVAIAADIVLATAMPRDWTVAAIGLGTSVGVTVSGIWLVVATARAAGPDALAGLRRAAAAAVTAGVAGALAGGLVARLGHSREVLPNLAAAVGVGLLAGGIHLAAAGLVDRPTVGLLLDRRRLRRA
jgi:putative peptidoglycan lipid II flippase